MARRAPFSRPAQPLSARPAALASMSWRRFIGACANSRRSMRLSCAETRGRKPIWPSTSFSRSMPGAISISFERRRRRLRNTARSVTNNGRAALLFGEAAHCSRSARCVRRSWRSRPSVTMRKRAVDAGDLEAARREGAAEDHVLGVLADIDEAADADDLVGETADVDVAGRIDLAERQEREIEAAAVIEIELIALVDQRVVVLRGARIRAGHRRAADESLLVGERDPVEDVLFGRDRRDAGRNSGAEIADRAGHELHRRAPRDDLALV